MAPLRTPIALLLGVGCAAVLVLVVVHPRAAPPPLPGGVVEVVRAAEHPSSSSAVGVVERWQRARASAYLRGDVVALRRLYTAGSPAGRRDVAVLRAYADRGLAVRLTTATARVTVLVDRPRRVVVREVARVVARARRGSSERLLPSGPWEVRRLELRRVGGLWRLSSASPASPRGQP